MDRTSMFRQARRLLPLAIVVVLLPATLAQVDLAATARALGAASVPVLFVGFAVAAGDLVVRTVRWLFLVRAARPHGPTPFHLAFACLGFGYLANLLLPARTGDLLRAHYAGRIFGMPRIAAFGTVLVERLADVAAILALAVVSSLIVAGVAAVDAITAYTLMFVAVAVVGISFAYWLIVRGPLRTSRLGALGQDLLDRLSVGMRAVASVRGAFVLAITTLAVAATALCVVWLATAAVGATLNPAQTVVFLTAITLALAIPGAPGGLGTYEFIGVVVLTSFGIEPERALAAVILLRLISAVPAMVVGVVGAGALGIGLPVQAPRTSASTFATVDEL